MRDDLDNTTLPQNLGDEGALPPDLVAIDAALAELARAEARSASPQLESRLMLATQSLLPRQDDEAACCAGELDALAAAERAEAGVAFEQRVFVATRAYLRRPEAGTPARRPRVVVVAQRWAALAAAVALAAVSVTVLMFDRDSTGPDSGPVAGAETTSPGSATELALADDNDFVQLVSAVWAPSADDGLSDLMRDVDLLTGTVRGDWFQFTALADEESM